MGDGYGTLFDLLYGFLFTGVWMDRFDDNAAVLLHRPQLNKETGKKDKHGKLVGTRVVGPVPMELRKGGWLKMLSLSSRVI